MPALVRMSSNAVSLAIEHGGIEHDRIGAKSICGPEPHHHEKGKRDARQIFGYEESNPELP